MLPVLLALATLTVAALFQTTIVVRLTLLEGVADLTLLTLLGWVLRRGLPAPWAWGVAAGALVGMATHLPLWLMLGVYLAITGLGIYLPRRVWDLPILNLFSAVLAGTVLLHGVSWLYLWVLGSPITLSEAFNLVLLPSLLLNFLLALPVFGLMGEFAKLVYPEEVANE